MTRQEAEQHITNREYQFTVDFITSPTADPDFLRFHFTATIATASFLHTAIAALGHEFELFPDDGQDWFGWEIDDIVNNSAE